MVKERGYLETVFGPTMAAVAALPFYPASAVAVSNTLPLAFAMVHVLVWLRILKLPS